MCSSDPVSKTTQLVLLGSGTPNADPRRCGPAAALIAGNQAYLVDFGPGVIRRAAAAAENGCQALEPARLTRAFATHLHSDHTAGYSDLLLTPGVLGRREPLEVFGPPGLEHMTRHLLEAYRDDLHERINGLEPAKPEAYVIHAHEIEPGPVYQDENVCIHAFPVRHGSWPAYGYRFETADRTVVISGDTAPVEDLLLYAQGCDVLLHEVYSVQGFKKRTPEWQAYHAAMHTSAYELGETAAQVRPGLLVLYHQLFWDVDEQQLINEIRTRYDGPVVSGKDLDVF